MREPETRNDLSAIRLGAVAIGAQAIGAFAVGALAVGTLALGAVAIGRLAIGRARIKNGNRRTGRQEDSDYRFVENTRERRERIEIGIEEFARHQRWIVSHKHSF